MPSPLNNCAERVGLLQVICIRWDTVNQQILAAIKFAFCKKKKRTIHIITMKFALGITALLAAGTTAFAPANANNGRTTSLSSTAEATYTFTKSEEIFAEAQEVLAGC